MYQGYKYKIMNTTGKYTAKQNKSHSMDLVHTHDQAQECRACYVQKLTERFKNYDLNK